MKLFSYIKYLLILCATLLMAEGWSQQTQVQYLSGTGKDDMVNWQFKCSGGANAGRWTTIGVPSCWELQGFGKYDYGFSKETTRGKESGDYQYEFKANPTWKNKVVNIVFEGVATDATIKINGQEVGTHQGAYYSFKFDITKLLKFDGSNLLEVHVAKHSANESVNDAERRGDFWLFGGIFRPVFLEILPMIHIQNIGIDAKADGSFMAVVNTESKPDEVKMQLYDEDGIKFQKAVSYFWDRPSSKMVLKAKFLNAKQWSSEFPNMYKAVFSIYKGGILVHTVSKKFGFRTVESKQRDGIYVNGVKMKFKGVNRHSFWPTSGRTTSKQLSIEDVQLMKDMNMNAVRMSHYPPDGHFLDVCDSLGLFVMDELAGWHGHYDTPTGKKLIDEMIEHDENHPSIIFWANGNEGGHNLELDTFFKNDLQQRPVVHPWQLFNGIETQHYREYNYGIGNYNHGHDIVMPTEFLHGLYDGGHGAGLEDYWEAMWHDPLSAGGFLWDFADEGVVRKDKHDSIDTDGNHGADGIVGPFHEKEGSYFTIKEVWSPIHFEKKEITPAFDGKLDVENRYSFTNTKECTFSWKLQSLNWHGTPDYESTTNMSGKVASPNIAPKAKGQLSLTLPKDWNQFDVLNITVKDPRGNILFVWSFKISKPKKIVDDLLKQQSDKEIKWELKDSVYKINANNIHFSINKNTGVLSDIVSAHGREIPLGNGPIIQEAANNFSDFTIVRDGRNVVIRSTYNKSKSYNVLEWTVFPNGWLKMKIDYFPSDYFTSFVGANFSFPDSMMGAMRYIGDGPYRVWKNRMKGTRFGKWQKEYNNTETGEQWNYPEFKGYYSNLYWAEFICSNQDIFTVATETEDLFLRLFTPAWKTDQWHNYEPTFPKGDISFMQGISSIGTKTQRNITTGPMGDKNIFYDYDKDPKRALKMVLYFNFSGASQ